jgi:hypothetical protein
LKEVKEVKQGSKEGGEARMVKRWDRVEEVEPGDRRRREGGGGSHRRWGARTSD